MRKAVTTKRPVAGQPEMSTRHAGAEPERPRGVWGDSAALRRFSKTRLMRRNPPAVSPAQEAAPGARTHSCPHHGHRRRVGPTLQTDAGRVGPSRPLSPLWVTYAAGPRGRRSDRLRSAFHGLSPGSDGGRPQAWAGPTAPEAPLQLRPLGGPAVTSVPLL